jgi:serine protease Do
VNDAVVSVVATKDVPVYERYFEEYNPFGDWFGGFSIPRVRENGTEEQEVGGGTGFVVSADGLIVTNRHVVADDEASYSVMFQNGQVYDVAVKAKDPVLDIAILEIADRPETPLPYLTFGDSAAVRLGESVIAIGNALAEFDNSVSVGIISGRGRSITARDGMGQSEELSNVFQTDAAINPGNSGGPLLNLDGEVIGVNVAASLGAENIGFAIPSEAVALVVNSVVTYGEIRRPFLGVRYTMITERIQRANNLSVDYGALVARGETREELAVMPGSPADKAGLRENDIILAIDGVKLDETDLANVLRTKAVDATITLRILRQGNEEEVVVTLAPAPTN